MSGRLREMRCELAYLKNADGSVCFSQGATCIWASCSGPGDIHRARANDEKMVLDVSFRANTGDNKFHPLNNIITSTLEKVINLQLFPHTTQVITLHGIQDDGSIGAAALNATCFALLDNGLPFDTIFCGVTIVRINGELIIDPTAKQESQSDAKILLAVCRNRTTSAPEICASDTIGDLTIDELENAWLLAKQTALSIFEFYRVSLERKHSTDFC
ncbi:unnamed protein product [Caenorhabditis angaria]|uniref:Uncharacterized protein n=1 Tax=Caenorhabditis angaria TaxID=860376 RepID=A0A9P1ICF5_9PELO|nr:unnamed protein product [Caenorhabditis angaria]